MKLTINIPEKTINTLERLSEENGVPIDKVIEFVMDLLEDAKKNEPIPDYCPVVIGALPS